MGACSSKGAAAINPVKKPVISNKFVSKILRTIIVLTMKDESIIPFTTFDDSEILNKHLLEALNETINVEQLEEQKGEETKVVQAIAQKLCDAAKTYEYSYPRYIDPRPIGKNAPSKIVKGKGINFTSYQPYATTGSIGGAVTPPDEITLYSPKELFHSTDTLKKEIAIALKTDYRFLLKGEALRFFINEILSTQAIIGVHGLFGIKEIVNIVHEYSSPLSKSEEKESESSLANTPI